MSRAISLVVMSIPFLFAAGGVSADPGRIRAGASGFVPVVAVQGPFAGSARAEPERRFGVSSARDARFYTLSVEARPEAPTVERRMPPAERRIRPLSVNPVDPGAVVARTPSGRTFIGPAPGAYVASPDELAYYTRKARPYAPPSFQIVGAASSRHMERPVRLTYGVQPEEPLKLGPKVVWLDGRDTTDEPNPHIRYLK